MKQDKKSFTQLGRKTAHRSRQERTSKLGSDLKTGQNSLTGFIHIREVIDNITSTIPINFDDIMIWKLWDGVVGEKIAKHARPSSIKRGILLVKVTDSVWVQELEFMAETIKDSLNSKLQREAIKKIRFRVGAPQIEK